MRALHDLVHGKWMAAVQANALVVLVLPIYSGLVAWRVLRRRSPGRPSAPVEGVPASWIWALVGMVLAFGILRNLPGAPFTWLSP